MADKFKGSNKAEWLELIEKSSKGKSIKSFSKTHSELQINAFNMASDAPSSGSLIKQNLSWKIGIKSNVNDPHALNKIILHYLNLGAEAISVAPENSDALKIIYKDVHADWIHNDLSLNGQLTIEEIKSFFPKGSEISFLSDSLHKESACQLSVIPELNDDPVQYLSNLLSLASNYIEQDISLDKSLIHIVIGTYLPIQLSMLRAVRILWANLMKANDLEYSSINIAAHIQMKESDKDLQLIEQTVATMNAAMGGADIIYFEVYDEKESYERLSLHIQNIMKMESKMEKDVDVLAGSFAIEKITTDLAQSAWQRFLNMEV